MKPNERKLVDGAMENLNDLERFLDERIVELAQGSDIGLKQARHAFIFYRTFIWEANRKLRSL